MTTPIYLFELQALAAPSTAHCALLAEAAEILGNLADVQYKIIVTSVADFAKIRRLNIATSQCVLCESEAVLQRYVAQWQHEKVILFVNHFSQLEWCDPPANVDMYIIDHQDNLLPEPNCHYANSWLAVKHVFGE